MAQHAIIRLPAVKARTGLSRSTIYSFIKAGSSYGRSFASWLW
ncbi:MAG TPA: hypothetical protein DIT28_14420 [Oxalobacteraceae bacterium]|nr:hypothetical protein [Oxalobacteraceae bacterium]